MPLDMGSQDQIIRSASADRLDSERATLGLALKAQRQQLGLDLDTLADRTRVRRAYLQALEESDWSGLPSGPFAAGYAKLYAQAVGLNGDKAAAALRQEWPSGETALPPPVGLAYQDGPRRSPLPLIAAGLLVVGVVGWNVVQRASAPLDDPATPPPVEAAWLVAGAPADPVVRVSAPTAPPPDQNAPTPYETPGLAAALAAAGENAAVLAPVSMTTVAPAPAEPQAPVGAAFNPRAAVHGAPPQLSRVTVQARRPASVVVRRTDGAILFARQLTAGEAYRAPLETGLVLDVSEPAAFDVYRDGEFQGQLREPQSRVDRFLG